MKRYGFLFLCLLALSPLSAQDTLTVGEAFRQGLIRVSVKGNGGFSGEGIRLSVQNQTQQQILLSVPPGQLFASKDSSVQDLVTTAPMVFALSPRAAHSVNLFTMCTQSYNMGPRSGEAFSLGKMVDGHLLKLVRLIAENDYQTSTAQSAVWSVANGDPVSSIYGIDTLMVRRVANVVSEATGTPITRFHIEPRRHSITAIRTSLECWIPRDLSRATLAAYDAQGNEVRRYFENQPFQAGFMQFRIGLHHTEGDSAEFHLRLTEGGEVISSRQLFPSDTVLPLVNAHSQTVLSYKASRNLLAEVGLYDAQGRLYVVLGRNKRIPAGYHRSTFIVGKDLPAGQDYVVKITANDEVIASGKFDISAAPPLRPAKRTVAGVFRFRLEAPVRGATFAVYDESGEMIRIFFEDSNLQPGNKILKYSFGHFQGPEARLYLRITDSEGQVIQEELVRP